MAEHANWYVVHTYSGYENTVKATIEKYVENRHLQDLIHEISIPLETVTEITENGPKDVQRKVFPGYVLVKMIMTDETWHVVRNIRGVTGFLGSGNKPIPLSEDDIASLGVEKREIVVQYQVGDNVRITDGALESFLGVVEEIDLDRVAEPRSFTLEDGSGTNTVQVERGRIRVSAADCPDQVCVKQGWISGGAVPIICLPHRLTIEIVDGGGDLDGAAG